MRAYLALIKDSFREAMASKVLWIVLMLITILFIALAPLSFERQLRSRFDSGDIENGPALIAKMIAAADEEAPSPAKRVWSLLDDEDRRPVRPGRGGGRLRRPAEVALLAILAERLGSLLCGGHGRLCWLVSHDRGPVFTDGNLRTARTPPPRARRGETEAPSPPAPLPRVRGRGEKNGGRSPKMRGGRAAGVP